MDLEYPELDRLVRYRPDGKGDIVHIRLSDMTVVGRERFTRRALDSLLRLCSPRTGRTQIIAQFNTVASQMVEDVDHFSYCLEDKGTVLLDVLGRSKNISITPEGFRRFSVAHRDPIRTNFRYSVDLGDHAVILREMEPMMPENFNRRYDDPIVSVYEVARNT